MNSMVVLKVALVLFFVGALANVEARLDLEAIAEARMDLLTSATKPFNAFTIFNSQPTESGACCDTCLCTRSYPPQCRCSDITLNGCHANCKACMCTRSLPGQCRCLDITDSCLPECSSTKAH